MSDWDNPMAATNADCDHFNFVSSHSSNPFSFPLPRVSSHPNVLLSVVWHPESWVVHAPNWSTPMTTDHCSKNNLNVCILPVLVRSVFAWLFVFSVFDRTHAPIRYLLMDPISNTHRFNCIPCLLLNPAKLTTCHCSQPGKTNKTDYPDRWAVKESDSDTVVMVIMLVAGVGGVFFLFALMALCYR